MQRQTIIRKTLLEEEVGVISKTVVEEEVGVVEVAQLSGESKSLATIPKLENIKPPLLRARTWSCLLYEFGNTE